MKEYLDRRKVNVGKKMRAYFDNYFKFDKEYSAMTDEQKDEFVARQNVMSGGRAGYQTGGMSSCWSSIKINESSFKKVNWFNFQHKHNDDFY